MNAETLKLFVELLKSWVIILSGFVTMSESCFIIFSYLFLLLIKQNKKNVITQLEVTWKLVQLAVTLCTKGVPFYEISDKYTTYNLLLFSRTVCVPCFQFI